MSESILVLTAGYLPVGTVHWTKAIGLVWQRKAEVVEESAREVRSPTVRMRVPSIVRLKDVVHVRRRRVRLSRRNLFFRDGFICQYCGRQLAARELNIDHVVPRAKGGKTHWTNLVTSCRADNAAKGGRTPEEAGMRLIREPRVPGWTAAEEIRAGFAGRVPERWRIYFRGGNASGG